MPYNPNLEEINNVQNNSDSLLETNNEEELRKDLINQLLNPEKFPLPQQQQTLPSPMDLVQNNLSSNTQGGKSPRLMCYEQQTMIDNYTQGKLEEIATEDLLIKIRLRDTQTLMKELSNHREDFQNKETISLDQYMEHIKKFQQQHFPAICNQNRSIITEDQNPFPEQGIDYEKVTKNQLHNMLDNLHILVEQETNALTYLSINLKETTEKHALISYSIMQYIGKKTEEEQMVQNQKTQ